MFVGPGEVLVTADVSFDGGNDTDGIDGDITRIEERLREIDGRVAMVYIEPET